MYSFCSIMPCTFETIFIYIVFGISNKTSVWRGESGWICYIYFFLVIIIFFFLYSKTVDACGLAVNLAPMFICIYIYLSQGICNRYIILLFFFFFIVLYIGIRLYIIYIGVNTWLL